jgi:tRNA-splicing ligase RtcB (3'-phosphate/5'-hydroxy nucleic acid ligase)
MRVDGLVFASDQLILKAKDDRAVDQVANVAHLPGIVGYSIAMPDIHWGYGFPIGGVAATDVEADGVVSPGGVGFDIGCGVRLLRSEITIADAKGRLGDLVDTIAARIPRGVGQKGLQRVTGSDFKDLLREGVRWPLSQGIGWPEDEELSEDRGRLESARPEAVSEKSMERGAGQLGSLGAGNHFLEVQVVDGIFSDVHARAMGLFEGQICVMIHTGSRGLGHQICTEDIRKVESAMRRLGIEVPDRQLACVPLGDPAGDSYMGAMAAAANFARANRHVLADAVRGCFEEVFHSSAKKLGLDLVYDVSHNVAKIEEFEIDGHVKKLCVHRKGATRSFGPGHPELPERYKETGQPVLIPGSMGTASWVLSGTNESRSLSFASTCHGAGRMMSRKAAVKQQRGQDLKNDLEKKGILVRAQQMRLLAEEAPYAYKDVDEVVEVCDSVGLSKKVARLRPLAVVKG